MVELNEQIIDVMKKIKERSDKFAAVINKHWPYIIIGIILAFLKNILRKNFFWFLILICIIIYVYVKIKNKKFKK